MSRAYIVRVLEIQEIAGEYFYTQLERKKRHGPFKDITDMLVHLNKDLLREILQQFRKQLH
jgi:hypothetical protein